MPKIKLTQVQKAVNTTRTAVGVFKETMPLVQPLIDKHGPAIAEKVNQKTKQAGEALGSARNSLFTKIKQHRADRKSKKEQEEAKQRALACSITEIPAKEFFKNFEGGSSPDDLRNGYMAIPGCYAILTMKSARETNLANYKEVFVGCSDKVGFDVYAQLRGFGNIDVYADFKYDAPMKVLIFPCDEDQLEANFIALVEDLQSLESYNKWDAMKLIESETE